MARKRNKIRVHFSEQVQVNYDTVGNLVERAKVFADTYGVSWDNVDFEASAGFEYGDPCTTTTFRCSREETDEEYEENLAKEKKKADLDKALLEQKEKKEYERLKKKLEK